MLSATDVAFFCFCFIALLSFVSNKRRLTVPVAILLAWRVGVVVVLGRLVGVFVPRPFE